MVSYKQSINLKGEVSTTEVFKIIGDSVFSVPFDDENKDYQEYLAWLSAGNKPENPDELA